MADEPDNLMLQLLREIRFDVWTTCDRRFDEQGNAARSRIEQRLDEVHETMYTVAGFAMHANVRHDTVTDRLKTLEERVSRLEEKA